MDAEYIAGSASVCEAKPAIVTAQKGVVKHNWRLYTMKMKSLKLLLLAGLASTALTENVRGANLEDYEPQFGGGGGGAGYEAYQGPPQRGYTLSELESAKALDVETLEPSEPEKLMTPTAQRAIASAYTDFLELRAKARVQKGIVDAPKTVEELVQDPYFQYYSAILSELAYNERYRKDDYVTEAAIEREEDLIRRISIVERFDDINGRAFGSFSKLEHYPDVKHGAPVYGQGGLKTWYHPQEGEKVWIFSFTGTTGETFWKGKMELGRNMPSDARRLANTIIPGKWPDDFRVNLDSYANYNFTPLNPSAPQSYPMITMGHSRGGAMADIAALHLGETYGSYDRLGTITFGQVWPFSAPLTDYLDKKHRNTAKFHGDGDPGPAIRREASAWPTKGIEEGLASAPEYKLSGNSVYLKRPMVKYVYLPTAKAAMYTPNTYVRAGGVAATVYIAAKCHSMETYNPELRERARGSRKAIDEVLYYEIR